MEDITSIKAGVRFTCAKCPFKKQCEHYGISLRRTCEVIDYHHNYVTIKPPTARAIVFRVDRGLSEDIIPTEKEVVAESLLNKVREKTEPEKNGE